MDLGGIDLVQVKGHRCERPPLKNARRWRPTAVPDGRSRVEPESHDGSRDLQTGRQQRFIVCLPVRPWPCCCLPAVPAALS